MSGKAIYLDFNATTPVAREVLEAMLPYLGEEFGNPSSAYALGRRARDAVEAARGEVASLIGARSDEIVFTGGGTEASNHAIRGVAAAAGARRRVVTSAVEHPATAVTCVRLEREGFDVVRVGVDRTGRVDLGEMAAKIDRDTALVTIIHAQNEIGTLQPLAEISQLAKANGAVVHADAAQSIGKVPVDVDTLGVDLLSIAGHKLYAPKGIGALYIRRHGTRLGPFVDGAGQEHGLRPGTENVPYIVGLGVACRIAREKLGHAQSVAVLRNLLEAELKQRVPGLVVTGHPTERLPNTLNVLFPGVLGSDLLDAAPGVWASTGSACHAGDPKPSSVLLALGFPAEQALGAVRLSLGRTTTVADVSTAARSLAEAWSRLSKG